MISKFLLSTHIPKTGGISFRKVLYDLYGDTLLFDSPINPKRNLDQWRDNIVKNNICALHGHAATLTKWEEYIPPFIAVTWVRDPYTRVFSGWEFSLNMLKAGVYPKYTMDTLGLKSIIEDRDFGGFCKSLSNYQSRHVDTQQLERYDFVGIFEEYQACLDYFLENVLHEDAVVAPVENFNRERGPGAVYELTKDQKALIRKYNEKDFELYARAKERWI